MSSLGLVGIKSGMTRVFKNGQGIPVTVIKVTPNRVSQIKSKDKDGYCALQVTFGDANPRRITKALAGHYAKANVAAGVAAREFHVTDTECQNAKLGQELTVSLFKEGQSVDVIGITKGRGFTGAIRRHNFKSQRASHGNSLSHNAPGSIGQNQSPGRVFPGKKMAGQYGNEQRTIQNLEVVSVDLERNCLLIKGAIPGAEGGHVVIVPSIKTKSKSEAAA